MWGRRSYRRKVEVSEDHSVARNISFILAGIGIGSAIALLMAPDSGEEVRHAIRRRYHHTLRRIGRSTEDLRDRVEDLLEHAGNARSARSLGLKLLGLKLLGLRRRREAERRFRAA